ncbi:MAG: ABC transporter permease, partial [Acidobacteriota bacterium]|nr:ABC transporter permease [Acidobacteriota bacterium]
YTALKEGGRAMAGGTRGHLVRRSLVLAEMALALVLLIGAGLLIQSFSRLQSIKPGFEPAGILTVGLSLPPARYSDTRQAAFYQEATERIAALPGVKHAASIYPLPLDNTGNFVLIFNIAGRPLLPAGQQPVTNVRIISPDYFKTMAIPVVRGREFAASDSAKGQPVAIVNQTFVTKFFPQQNPLGQRVTFGDPQQKDSQWLSIVGVVGDVRHNSLNEQPDAEAYWPQVQNPIGLASLVVRGDGDPAALTRAVREQIRAIDHELPVDRVRTMADVVTASLAQSRFKAVLLGLFAALALVLAAIGVYGVVSYSVAQRTHEIGIRMALGAPRQQVLRMVVQQGMSLVLVGLAAGLVLAWFATRLLADQVYGVSTGDPLTYLVVPLTLTLVALAANVVPARRATRVDPLEALRYE